MGAERREPGPAFRRRTGGLDVRAVADEQGDQRVARTGVVLDDEHADTGEGLHAGLANVARPLPLLPPAVIVIAPFPRSSHPVA